MTYEEAFDWIEDNMDPNDYDDYEDFLNAIRQYFPDAQNLINTLDKGVIIMEKQLTLEQFFENLRPDLTK